MKREKESGKIVVSKDGPYLVTGSVPLGTEAIVLDGDGIPYVWKKKRKYPDGESYSLCHCGRSADQPYCDGSHTVVSFDGTETAEREPFAALADSVTEGPELELADAKALCANARFCGRKGGVWNLTRNSGDPETKRLAIEQVGNCPAGRLVATDRMSGTVCKPDFPAALSIVEDPVAAGRGPIWVKGGVPVESSDGYGYERRNRVTLCRCGKSGNKPLCDGAHTRADFDEENRSIPG